MKCALHSNEDAIASCAKCGLGMCNDCISEVTIKGRKVCPSCGIGILQENLRTQQEELNQLENLYGFHKSRFRVFGIWVGIAAVLGILAACVTQGQGFILYPVITYPAGLYFAFVTLIRPAGQGERLTVGDRLKQAVFALLLAPIAMLVCVAGDWWNYTSTEKKIPAQQNVVTRLQDQIQNLARRFGLQANL
ncbi:hypothetical protein FACS189419_07610 [Planctomycetales bacterium]|nr:hypothetical protein FACS189419_07610 [Planctomycetales bacterium]